MVISLCEKAPKGLHVLLDRNRELIDIIHVIASRETVSRVVDAIIPFVVAGMLRGDLSSMGKIRAQLNLGAEQPVGANSVPRMRLSLSFAEDVHERKPVLQSPDRVLDVAEMSLVLCFAVTYSVISINVLILGNDSTCEVKAASVDHAPKGVFRAV